MGSAEPKSGRSREEAPEPAAPQPSPVTPGRVATIVALQRSAGNAAVARLIGGRPPVGSTPPPPQPTAGDASITAGLADAARERRDPAREIVDAAAARLDPGKQVPAFQQLAERHLAVEEQATGAPAQRIQALAKALEEEAIKELSWGPLNKLGEAQTPGFDAGRLVREVRGAIEGWGTDEKRLFAALEGHTPLQIAAMRKAYRGTYERDMDEDIDGDLGGSEAKRAKALLTGDPIAGAVATLRDAMDGIGTDEATIMRTLRGRSAAELTQIAERYEATYKRPLKADLDDELSGYEFREAEALLHGDGVKADAMALKGAMDGIGTDEAAIHAVYARIRDEVEHQAAEKGWKTAQVQAEIKRRTAELKTVYGGKLEEDLRGELSGGELELALAEQAGDETAMDAATLRIEHQSAWTSDDKVNEVLKSQYQRAEREIMRDLAVDFQRTAGQLPREQRAAAWKALQAHGRELAEQRSHENMKALRTSYGELSFDVLIDTELSGYSKDEAKERIAAGGKLTDERELKYAIFGPGTNEKTIRQVLKGKSKAELDALGAAYRQLTGNDLLEDLKGDLSGRDEADMTFLLETGDASLEERRAYLDKRTHWELNEGTGRWGALADDEEAQVLNETNAAAGDAYRDYEALKDLPEDDPRRRAAQERLERWLGYGEKDIERHREQLDSITDTIAMVGAITVGIAMTILSGGAGGVAALALFFGVTETAIAAGVGAVSAAAASMWIKENMKGKAYGGEEIAADVAVQTANVVVTVATAGVGEAAIKALSRAPAFAILARAAESGALARVAVKGAGSGVEGLIQGLPTGMMGAILNEDTWRSPNPLAVILAAGGKSALQTAGTAAAMGTAMHGVHEGVRGLRGAGEPAADLDAIDRHAGPRDLDDVISELDAERELDELAGPLGAEPIVDPPADVPITDLWDGTIIHNDPPFTAVEAERVYWNTIKDSKGREAMVLRNVLTDEHVVVQGNESEVAACRSALDSLRLEGKPGPWRPVRHFHGADASGMTPMKYRYPSGIGGDMAGARRIAMRTGKVHTEWIDIVTERGPEKVYFGYDPVAKRYLVSRPTKGGPGNFESFAELGEYHEWVEGETGEPLEVLGRADDDVRKSSDPASVDDGWDADPIPELPDSPAIKRAAELIERYPTAESVREAVLQRLGQVPHGMDPSSFPETAKIQQVLDALRRSPDPNDHLVADAFLVVVAGLRNPELYAEVFVEAFERMRKNALSDPDVNRALAHLVRQDGSPIAVIPKKYGVMGKPFFKDYASAPAHFVDLPFLNLDHGAMTHILQDLVVNKALAAAGSTLTSTTFRAMLRACQGWMDNVTGDFSATQQPAHSPVGEVAWEESFDYTDNGLNRPEVISPILRDLFGLQ